MQGFLAGLIFGAAAALGGLYYYGSFEVMDREFSRNGAGDDYAVEETTVIEDVADVVAEDVVEEAGDDMADAVEEAGDMADVVEDAVEEVVEDTEDAGSTD